ncbi:hypothetical protein GCM10010171_42930 [Actinokineospora fastidiosa]|uniref:VanZ-like domain-containing protein n=2 Tax=Actinokineospora fastidiosa TaxID=1816 RepID=A0A918GLH3_9PSEU|nr:hypothetical protein GCM10010171_42930 [Actinokineospora fastidiosa]
MEMLWRLFGDVLPLTLFALPVVIVLACALAALRRRRGAWRLIVADVLVMMAALPVAYLVFVPVGGGERTSVSLIPGADLFGAYDEITVWRLVGNLFLLMPLGMIAPLRWRWLRSMKRVALSSACVAVGIELGQWLLPVGRVVAFDDALLNFTGATLGAAVTWAWWRDRAPARHMEV